MANANRPTGLTPVKHISGSPYNGQCNLYAVLAADTNAFAIGDPVISAASAAADGTPAVTLAAATGAIRGVVVGVLDTKSGGVVKKDNPGSLIRPAAAQSKDWYVLVADDPGLIFEVQEVGTGTPLTAAEIGLNANLVAGTNNGYVSGWTLDNAAEAVTATLQCRILGLVPRIDNAFGQYAKYLVKINTHELDAGAAGVAGTA